MKLSWIILSVALLARAAIAQAQTTQPAATGPSDQIASLIAQLDDPNFGVRELAEKKLTDLGPSIEPQLRDALRGNLSDEARARIDALIARFQESMALHAMVTMHYTNAPLMKVLEDFGRQAGGNLGIDDPSVARFAEGRTATINLDNADFWQALHAVKDASGLSPGVGPSGLTLAPAEGRVFLPVDFANKYARSSGGLFIVPPTGREDRSIDYGTGQTTGALALMLNVFPEPKLHVIGATNFDWLKDCVDDKGHSLMPASNNRRFFNPGFIRGGAMRQSWWQLQTILNEVPNMGTKIARLHGEVNLLVQTRSQDFEIDDIMQTHNASTQDGPVTFTVQNYSKTQMNFQINLMVTGMAINDLRIQDITSSAELVDDKGLATFHQTCIPRPAPPGVSVLLIFPLPPNNPVKLRWEKTLEQKKLSIPFELDDLPFPAAR